jgi:predicted hydrolase (HD superfamily)
MAILFLGKAATFSFVQPVILDHGLLNKGPYQTKPTAMLATAQTNTANQFTSPKKLNILFPPQLPLKYQRIFNHLKTGRQVLDVTIVSRCLFSVKRILFLPFNIPEFIIWQEYFTSPARRLKMPEHVPTYDQAAALLKEFNGNESLLKHAYAVEGVMRFMARKKGEDEEKWGIIGLVHDLDYERFPEQHCTKTREILAERGWPEEYIRAVAAHGWGICSDVEPKTDLEKMLYTVDELTGLINAVAIIRPSKSVADLEAKSVMKKWKDKAFAAGVNRSVIEKGCTMLGIELNELVADSILAMRAVAGRIGL